MKQIRSFANARAQNKGDALAFDIVTTDGGKASYVLPAADLGRIILLLTGAAKALNSNENMHREPSTREVFPIPLTEIRCIGGRQNEGLLAINVSGYWLEFEADIGMLATELRFAARQADQLVAGSSRRMN